MIYTSVQIETSQNIILDGFFYKSNSNRKCIFYIPGMAGNFLKSPFAINIAEKVQKIGYDFLAGHNQGSHIEKKLVKIENNKVNSVLRGGSYENFEDCIYDIEAWLNLLIKEKYQEIIVIAHSRGCNKIIHYLNNKKNTLIKKIILLAPQDNSNFKDLQIHMGMFEEAKMNMQNNEYNKILNKPFLGFMPISSKTYYDEFMNCSINNIPYKNPNGDYSRLSKINQQIYIMIGSKDIGENGKEYLDRIKRSSKNSKYKIIDGANHNFKNKEQVLVDLIIDWLEE